MDISKLKKVELEITSDCNAACPGCARTQNLDILRINSFTEQDVRRMFPNPDHIRNTKFKLCGVLGDPAFNPECLGIADYITSNGGYCQLSTNGAIQSADWWRQLGEISKRTGLLDVNFCIDGHEETNHVYRVNTVWKVLERNIAAYTDAGGIGTWIFIVFDHNEYELDAARDHAARIGLNFATRTGMRNSYHDWVAQIKKKENKKVVVKEKTITTTGSKEHTKKKHIEKLDAFIKNDDKTAEETQRIVSSIKCKYIHEGEIYIAADQTVWPCCFLHDSAFKNKENIVEKLAEYSTGWNSLKHHSLEEILNHEWFDKILEESWNPEHNKHLTRCIRTCAYNKAYHNEIKFEEKK